MMKWNEHETPGNVYHELSYGFGQIVVQRQRYGQHIGKWHVYDSNDIFDPVHLAADLPLYHVKAEAVAMFNSKLKVLMDSLEKILRLGDLQ
jgi:hypothetical protein